MSDWSNEERAFLDTVKKDWGPSAAVTSAVRDAVAKEIANPAATPDGPAPAPPAGSTLGMKVLAGGAALGVVAIALVWLAQTHETKAPIAPASAVSAPAESIAPPPSPSVLVPTPTEAVSVDSLPNATAQDLPALRAPARAAASADRPADADTLAEELALLRTAQAALRKGAPAEALTALDSHASRFPTGVLRDERMTLQVLALCDSGQVAAARAKRDELVRVAPGSSHLKRLETSCVTP